MGEGTLLSASTSFFPPLFYHSSVIRYLLFCSRCLLHDVSLKWFIYLFIFFFWGGGVNCKM